MAIDKNAFQTEMETHLAEFKERNQYLPPIRPSRRWQYPDFADNLYPPIRHAVLDYVSREGVLLHEYANHVRSSQAFAFNLLFPACISAGSSLLVPFGTALGRGLRSLDSFEFEFQAETDLLGEWRGETV